MRVLAGTGDTIFGLSSGAPPAGVAVIRVSGPAVRDVLDTLIDSAPEPRIAALRTIRGPRGAIDNGLVLFFSAPSSFTGEDVAEFQIHGGRAVVDAVLSAVGSVAGTRLAAPGEFTRRAFLNRRLDLSQVEGLADLVRAETEAQGRQALLQAEGGLRLLAEGWRARLMRARALVEAELDFGEEEGISGVAEARAAAGAVRAEIGARLDEASRGMRVRDGVSVVLLGAPNAGKSSLLNALAESEVAIVTAEPGTTRDLIEVALDLGGQAVTVVDTAGIRQSASLAEAEGIRRAMERAGRADLVLWLTEDGRDSEGRPALSVPAWTVRTKADLIDSERERLDAPASADHVVSVRTGEGLGDLLRALTEFAAATAGDEPALVTRARQVSALSDCAEALRRAEEGGPPEVIAEELRAATEAIGRLTGSVDVEQVLDVIFAEFCIGK